MKGIFITGTLIQNLGGNDRNQSTLIPIIFIKVIIVEMISCTDHGYWELNK